MTFSLLAMVVGLPVAHTLHGTETPLQIGGGEVWTIRAPAGSDQVQFIGRDPVTRAYIYESARFAFHSEVALPARRARELALACEATHALLEALPLPLHPLDSGQRHIVRFFASHSSYIAAGGFSGSYGSYDSVTAEVLIPLTSLDLRRPRTAWLRGQEGSLSTLAHEITHQVLSHGRPIPPIWLNEGLATFAETLPYRAGEYRLNATASRRFHDRLLSGISSDDLIEGLNLGPRQWSHRVRAGKDAAERIQSAALALTIFLLNKEQDGIANYLDQIDRGMPELLARTHLFDNDGSLPDIAALNW